MAVRVQEGPKYTAQYMETFVLIVIQLFTTVEFMAPLSSNSPMPISLGEIQSSFHSFPGPMRCGPSHLSDLILLLLSLSSSLVATLASGLHMPDRGLRAFAFAVLPV